MRISAKGAHYSAANRPRKQAPVQVQGNRISRQGWELCQYASSQPAFLSCLARTLFHRPFARHSARCGGGRRDCAGRFPVSFCPDRRS